MMIVKNKIIAFFIALLITIDIVGFFYFFITANITIFAISGTLTIFLGLFWFIYSLLENLK
jgi:hypothetical protein